MPSGRTGNWTVRRGSSRRPPGARDSGRWLARPRRARWPRSMRPPASSRRSWLRRWHGPLVAAGGWPTRAHGDHCPLDDVVILALRPAPASSRRVSAECREGTGRRPDRAQAADELAVTERFIRKLVADGQLRAVKVGARVVRIRRTDLEDLLRPARVIPSCLLYTSDAADEEDSVD